MADSQQQSPNLLPADLGANFVELVRAAVDENQPMCVVVVSADVPSARVVGELDHKPSYADVEAAVAGSLHERLEIQRRKYDTLSTIQGASFLLVVRTLADAPILNARLEQISEFLTKPHTLSGGSITVPVHIGAAIRQPNETADAMAGRIQGALQQARATNRGHVLMM